MLGIKVEERGWAGHFCHSSKCSFKRNTLVSLGNLRVVVSTVGAYQPITGGDYQEIGFGRYYETMAFKAALAYGIYWESNVSKEVNFDGKWMLDECVVESDNLANKMHDNAVHEISMMLRNGVLHDRRSKRPQRTPY